MSTAIAKVGGAQLARAEDGLTDDEIETIKRTIAVGATDAELKLFISTCKRLNLDPFARQVFFVKRKQKVNGVWVEKGESQVSIDGFRVVAERTGKYEGQDGPYWCGKDGVWRDVWLDSAPPVAARVGVFRTGHKQPMYAVALFEEYAATYYENGAKKLGPMWVKMPANQLAKCAESLVLRKAFPNDLSGVYTPDEMESVSQVPAEQPATRPTPQDRLDAIARGGERAESRPTSAAGADRPTATAATGETQSQDSAAHAADGTKQATASDGELLDAKAWRARYYAECDDAAARHNVTFTDQDDLGLPVPPFDEPKLHPKSKQHAGKPYSEVPGGYLREVVVGNNAFAQAELNKRLHALYRVCRHEILKEQINATPAT